VGWGEQKGRVGAVAVRKPGRGLEGGVGEHVGRPCKVMAYGGPPRRDDDDRVSWCRYRYTV